MYTSDGRTEHTTILIVEDDLDIGAVLVDLLTEETPYQIIHVENAAQALDVAQHTRPSLGLLDYRLPGNMNGVELAERLRAMDGCAAIPLILMSACLPVQDLARRKLIGLKKPFELDHLLQMLEEVMHP